MAHVYTEESNFENIANAIREKNGTDNTYAPSEMAMAIDNIKVGELDFKDVFDQEQAQELNDYYKNGIAHAEKIKAENPNPNGGWGSKFLSDVNLVFFPEIDLSNVTSLGNTFNSCYNLQGMPSKLNLSAKLQNLSYSWVYCYSLKFMPTDDIDCTNVGTLNNTWAYCYCLKNINLINLQNISSFNNTFLYCNQLVQIKLSGWKQANISLTFSSQLSVESIDNTIENAIDKVDGATDRTLTLHATAGANWDANSKYQGEERNLLLTQKGIEVTW